MDVLIFTYQNTQSDVFGEIFNQYPDGMYIFEPLDALYTSMYGTREGWNVPDDIFNWKYGSAR